MRTFSRSALLYLLYAALCLTFSVPLAVFQGCLDTEKSAGAEAEYRMRGDFRKGPFAANSDVRVSMLGKRGEPNGKNYRTATENDSGDFHLTLPGGVAEFSCTGKYFDELAGITIQTPLRLTAVAQIPQDLKSILHVNAFTHLASRRIERLMFEGKKFAAAAAQAEMELRRELGIANGEGSAPAAGTALDLLGGNNPHTLYLFGVTSILCQAAANRAGGVANPSDGSGDRSSRAMQAILDSLAADLERDGALNEGNKRVISQAERTLDPELARKGLEAWAKSKGSSALIPDLGKLVDTDRNGKPNEQDSDDDGDKVQDDLDCAPLDSAKQMISLSGQFCVAVYPPAPLSAQPGDGQAQLVWDPIPGDAHYSLVYNEGGYFDTSIAVVIDGALPRKVIGGLGNGKTYWFAVRSAYGERVSVLSPAVRVVPMGFATGFTAASGTGKVTLQWTSAQGASGYNLYFRAETAGAPGTAAGAVKTGTGVDLTDNRILGVTSPYTVTNLENGVRYAFALTSMSGASESRMGDTVHATPVRPPAKVELVSGEKRIIVRWDTAFGAAAYDLYWSKGDTTGTGGTRRANRTSPDTLTGLSNGQRYAVSVQSMVAGGSSSLAPAVISIPLAVPRGLSARISTGRVKVEWQPADGAATYSIYHWSGKNAPVRTTSSVTSYEVTGLPDGEPRYFLVAGSAGGIESSTGDTLAATPLAAPGIPIAVMRDGGVDLTWRTVAGAQTYSVFYGQGTAIDTTVEKMTVNDTIARVAGLVNDKLYAFILRAENQQGESILGFPCPGIPMQAPTGFTASAELDKVTLRWNDATGKATYNLYYAAAGAVDKKGIRIPDAVSPYVITGLDHGVQYTFAVAALKQGHEGPLSAPQTTVYAASTYALGGGGVSDSVASYLSLAVDASDRPYLAFIDLGRAGGDRNLPHVKAFDGSSWKDLGKPTDQPPYACCDLGIGPGEMPYLLFADAAQNNRLTLKAFDGSGWSGVGNSTVTDAKADFTALGIDGLGIPHVGYNDSASGGRASVRKLSGSKWVQVGLPGFSTNPSGPLNIAFTKANEPIVSSGGNGAVSPAVMAFDGTTWSSAGDVNVMLSRAAPGPVPIAVSPANQLFLAFPDRTSLYKASVFTASNSGWTVAGKAGFSDEAVQSMRLRIDSRGIPYVAFADESRGGRITVMKFTGGGWLPACRQGFSKGRAGSIDLAFGKSGSVHVAFTDAGQGGKAVVVKLNDSVK
ncbi:MAG: fibronectin type III domain-containing protein [Fibrobacteria bacterium]